MRQQFQRSRFHHCGPWFEQYVAGLGHAIGGYSGLFVGGCERLALYAVGVYSAGLYHRLAVIAAFDCHHQLLALRGCAHGHYVPDAVQLRQHMADIEHRRQLGYIAGGYLQHALLHNCKVGLAVAEGIYTAAVIGTAGRVDKQAVLRVGSGQIEPVAAVGTQRFQIVDTRICSIESQSVSYFRLPFDGDYRIALARQMHGVDVRSATFLPGSMSVAWKRARRSEVACSAFMPPGK